MAVVVFVPLMKEVQRWPVRGDRAGLCADPAQVVLLLGSFSGLALTASQTEEGGYGRSHPPLFRATSCEHHPQSW